MARWETGKSSPTLRVLELMLTATGLRLEMIDAHRRAAEQRIPRIRYEHAIWRGTKRRLHGVPDDHPTREELVSAVETRLAPH